jgi:hypothetical protein
LTDQRDGAGAHPLDGRNRAWSKRPQVSKTIRPRLQNNDTDLKRSKILLE